MTPLEQMTLEIQELADRKRGVMNSLEEILGQSLQSKQETRITAGAGTVIVIGNNTIHNHYYSGEKRQVENESN
jgi:hypothetical protein